MTPHTPQTANVRYFGALTFIKKLSGLSYTTLFGIWGGMVVLFGVAYFLLTFIGDGAQGPNFFEGASLVHLQDMPFLQRLYNAVYFSVITATSTGYGDIVPHGFSKTVASVQSISALLVFAVFVTKLVSHQQETTLNEVHRMTFEDVFHNAREGMFIARKDFDRIIRAAEEQKQLRPEHWEDLIIAYLQLQTIFSEIPDFYQNDVHQYTIDKKRELLLLECVHRTLHRINIMLDAFSNNGIDWVNHDASMLELTELTKIVNEITPVWKMHSPYDSAEAFEDIFQMKERMHLKMLNAIQ